MKHKKYDIKDINIGDEVYFDDVYSGKILTQSNFDEYWTVHGIDNDRLLVNLREEHYWSIKVSEVRQHIKSSENDS